MIKRSTLLKKIKNLPEEDQVYINNKYAQSALDSIEYTVVRSMTNGQATYINKLINIIIKRNEEDLEKILTGE